MFPTRLRNLPFEYKKDYLFFYVRDTYIRINFPLSAYYLNSIEEATPTIVKYHAEFIFDSKGKIYKCRSQKYIDDLENTTKDDFKFMDLGYSSKRDIASFIKLILYHYSINLGDEPWL